METSHFAFRIHELTDVHFEFTESALAFHFDFTSSARPAFPYTPGTPRPICSSPPSNSALRIKCATSNKLLRPTSRPQKGNVSKTTEFT